MANVIFQQEPTLGQQLRQFTEPLSEVLQGRKQQAGNVEFLKLQQSLGMIPPDVDIGALSALPIGDLTKTFAQKPGSAKPTPDELIAQADELVANGMPRREADLFIKSTPGVQQAMIRHHLDLVSRGRRIGSALQDDSTPGIEREGEVAESAETVEGEEKKGKYDWTPIASQGGLTPKEDAQFKILNQRENNKVLVKEREKRNSLKTAEIKTNKLRQINDRGNLPSGLSSVMIDTKGQIRPTASLAGKVNADTQQWVKTLNDFIGEAKTFFGGRVTNFDLESFMKRLPGLLNSDEGRRVIIEQMNLLSQLELLHSDATVDGLQFHGNRSNLADILGQVDDQVLDKEQEIINKINHVEGAASMLGQMLEHPDVYGGTELFFDPEDGAFHAVRKESADQAIEAGLQRWRVDI